MQKVTFYAIARTGTAEEYIGTSINVKNRWKTHRYDLKKGGHHCSALQQAWDLYGPDAFTFSVLKVVDCETLNERAALEIQLIKQRGSYNAMTAYIPYESIGPQSEAAKALQSATNRSKAQNDPQYAEFLRGRGEALTEFMRSDEGRANMAKHTKRRWQDPEERKRLRAGLDRKDPEIEAKRAANIGKAHSTPEMKAFHKANAAKMLENPELVAKMLDGSKSYWADPANRAKRAEKMRAYHAARRAAKSETT